MTVPAHSKRFHNNVVTACNKENRNMKFQDNSTLFRRSIAIHRGIDRTVFHDLLTFQLGCCELRWNFASAKQFKWTTSYISSLINTVDKEGKLVLHEFLFEALKHLIIKNFCHDHATQNIYLYCYKYFVLANEILANWQRFEEICWKFWFNYWNKSQKDCKFIVG